MGDDAAGRFGENSLPRRSLVAGWGLVPGALLGWLALAGCGGPSDPAEPGGKVPLTLENIFRDARGGVSSAYCAAWPLAPLPGRDTRRRRLRRVRPDGRSARRAVAGSPTATTENPMTTPRYCLACGASRPSASKQIDSPHGPAEWCGRCGRFTRDASQTLLPPKPAPTWRASRSRSGAVTIGDELPGVGA